MRISATGTEPGAEDGESGFTLIELLVVLTIMGLATAAVVLTMPDPRGRIRDEAEKFAARAHAAQSEAVLEARSIALVVDREGYGFESRSDGRWAPLTVKPFIHSGWSPGIEAMVGGDGKARITFDPTGIAEPRKIILARGDERATVTVGANGDVRVSR
jgi:general secretion pathway protein H